MLFLSIVSGRTFTGCSTIILSLPFNQLNLDDTQEEKHAKI